MSLPTPTASLAPAVAARADAAPVVTTDELPVIEVKHLVKEYRLGALEDLRGLARRLLGRGAAEPRKQFRALDDVSFSVKRGEVVGIIGHNGAGKSTLLKHLCRITTPTSGSVTVRGRVAPLIEVGAGLVGDMTGRENIYLNASILGLTRREIDSKIDEIIAFAELERFIDTPIKRYSSGMQIKLAFSIAVSFDAPIVLVDEVLAVGDIAFQRKCFAKMMAIIATGERTILIVGHNIRQLQRLCTRIIMLDHGKVADDGAPDVVVPLYYEMLDRRLANNAVAGRIESTNELFNVRAKVITRESGFLPIVSFESDLVVEISFETTKSLAFIEFAAALRTTDQIYVATESSGRTQFFDFPVGVHRIEVKFPKNPLLPGEYAVRLYIGDRSGSMIFDGDDMARFVVVDHSAERTNHSGISLVHFESVWRALPSPVV